MNRFDNPDIYIELDHDNTARSKRKRKRRLYALMGMGASLVLLLIVCMGTAFYIWVEGKMKAEDSDVIETGGQAVATGSYTQKELDELLEAAMIGASVKGNEAGRQEVLEQLRTDLGSGRTVMATLRSLYPEDLVVVSGGKYHFVPIDNNLKMNTYLQENLNVLENGQLEYVVDGQVTSYKGIDVSSHQGKIDWKKVAQDGVTFAFIRAGYRGYGTGKLADDDYFESNIKNATANGIKVGVYFFSQAITEEEAREEAKYVLDKIKSYKVECPIVFDVEKVADSEGRMNALSAAERTKVTKVFCETIKEAGYKPMIYHNLETGAVLTNVAEWEEYDKWFAYYSTEFYYPYEYKVWQYSDKGRVNGIKGNVDLNISFVPLWE